MNKIQFNWIISIPESVIILTPFHYVQNSDVGKDKSIVLDFQILK